jgi:type I restriction enzyme S subunit
MATNQGFKSLVPDSRRVDSKFLFYWLKSRTSFLQGLGNGATFKEISKAIVERIEIPLPPLDEQRRIAAILDKADALRRKRKRALDLLDSLTRSIFLEMFGNSKHGGKLTSEPIGSVCEVGSGSTPGREEASNFGGDIRWVKTTEVKGNVISDTEEKVTEQGVKRARLRLYPSGTVLVAMYGQGATRGKVGLLNVEATTNQACAALVPGPKLNSVFLFHQLRQSYNSLRSLGRGGNQSNLNGELVKTFEILVPPLDAQNRFVEIIDKASTLAAVSRKSLGNFDAVFSALQFRAFSGQL